MRIAHLITAAVFFVYGMAAGDVVIKSKSTADMVGLVTMEKISTDIIKGNKSFSDMTTHMTGGMMAKIGGGRAKQSLAITRLDKGSYFELDPEKKIYTETSLASLKEQYARDSKESGNNVSEYSWAMEAGPTGRSDKINGYDCTEIEGKAIGVKKGSPEDSVFITYVQWTAKNVPGKVEIENYQSQLSKAKGTNEMLSPRGQGQMQREYGPEIQKLMEKVKSTDGYPIKTIISIEGASSARNMAISQGNHNRTLYMTTEVLSIEEKPALDSQFELPSGYTKK